MTKDLILFSSIYISPAEDARIRESESLNKAVTARATSLIRFGQFSPIIVKPYKGEDGKEWELVDGQVRLISLMALTFRHGMEEELVVDAFKEHSLEPNKIWATTREKLSEVQSLMIEFHSNEDAERFTWEEKGRYIRRIHDMLQQEHGRKKWKAKHTAEYITQSEAVVSQFLQLTDEQDPATQVKAVKKATSKGAALKQLKIAKDHNVRKARVRKVVVTEDVSKYAEAATLSVFKGDCREWVAKIPDESLDWFHWDPPYGGKEGEGGAFSAHEAIQTEHEYAITLMMEMFDEIHRVLRDGSWTAIWYTPVHYNWLRLALQGHRFEDDGICVHCKKHLIKDYYWLCSNYSCRKSPVRFWVNPYPNLWRKTDRVADGHEITRFFIKETEPFLLAGKQGSKTPTLVRTDRGQVFDFKSVVSAVRKHVHHKPWPLLMEILSCISVPGSLGGDAGGGSGSIIEAASMGGRKVLVAELNGESHINCLEVAVKVMTSKKLGPDSLAPWLKERMK